MTSNSVGSRLAAWLFQLGIRAPLPADIEVLTPYSTPEVQRVVEEFCQRYVTGRHKRLPIYGINPGRLGAGITGLAFTDPWAVEHQLNIPTELSGKREPSATFVSAVIDAYGGPDRFYNDVLLTALSPLGFIRNGININFYDIVELEREIVPFMLEHYDTVSELCGVRDYCLLLGSGKLRSSFQRFVLPARPCSHVVTLDHPRYIMQYKRSQMETYVQSYVDVIVQTVAAMRTSAA